MSVDPPVRGLVLSGGASKRMRTDKAALMHQGQTWLSRQVQLLESASLETFVSIRADQAPDPLRTRFKTIVDDPTVNGPIAGILAAFREYPHSAWLVVAVDLPHLQLDTVQRLLEQRQSSQLATAYVSQSDQLPEPLCAIYEPAAHDALKQFVATGRACPRKFLTHHAVTLLTQPGHGHLDNINTPEEWDHHSRETPV